MSSSLETEIREIKTRIAFYEQLKKDQHELMGDDTITDPIDKYIKLYAEKLILLEKKTQLKSG